MSILGAGSGPGLSNTEARHFDWVFLGSVFFIVLLGVINLYSATADPNHGQIEFLWKQLVFLGVGFSFVFALLLFDYRLLEHIAYGIYAFNLLLLVGVKFFGVVRNGARLWYDFGFLAFQPSETMKLAMILALGKYFHGKTLGSSLSLPRLVLPGILVLIPSVITMAQPDMGTGFHMLTTGAVLLLFVGIRMKLLVGLFALALMSFPLVWEYGLQEYQRDRIRVVIDPMRDPQGRGYNALQSMIAVGSGQIIGKGFRQGTQTQLGFTPEGYTDFIFTVMAEEWGFIGCVIFLMLYLLMLYRCFMIAAQAREKFGALIVIGVASMIALQVIINLSMVVGIFPIVGIPLPLASYGGTSVLNICLALALVLNVSYRRNLF